MSSLGDCGICGGTGWISRGVDGMGNWKYKQCSCTAFPGTVQDRLEENQKMAYDPSMRGETVTRLPTVKEPVMTEEKPYAVKVLESEIARLTDEWNKISNQITILNAVLDKATKPQPRGT
jgi:hypothetical protein